MLEILDHGYFWNFKKFYETGEALCKIFEGTIKKPWSETYTLTRSLMSQGFKRFNHYLLISTQTTKRQKTDFLKSCYYEVSSQSLYSL